MKLNNILIWMGTVIAGIAAVVYLFLLYILINGMSADVSSDKLFLFLLLGAIDGVLISGSLRFQGVSFAKAEPKNKAQIDEYIKLQGKSKTVKFYPIWVMYLRTTFVDIFFKGSSILATMYFSINILIEGMQDQKYFLLGIINVIMFIGLGMMSLAGGYNHYQEKQVPYLDQKIDNLKEEKKRELLEETKRDSRPGFRESNGPVGDITDTNEEGLISRGGDGESRAITEACEA